MREHLGPRVNTVARAKQGGLARGLPLAEHSDMTTARQLDGNRLVSPEAFYEEFFRVAAGLLPDYGGRNLDALNDDLRELSEPLALTIVNSSEAKKSLGDWLDRVLEVFAEREAGDCPVSVHLA